MKILTFVGRYLPGYKAGGPIRSVSALVAALGGDHQFKIITSDRDLNDASAYEGVRADQWSKVGQAEVYYTSPRKCEAGLFRGFLCSLDYDVVYLNSFFSFKFTILPLLLNRLRLVPNKPVVPTPRGEFSLGALKLKWLKKRIYIFLSKALGLYRDIVWQASSEYEAQDIRKILGNDVHVQIAILVASDLSSPPSDMVTPTTAKEKVPGHLNIVFLSRISRKKNLHGALQMLSGLIGQITFNIYGPIEDKDYWMECERLVRTLPENVTVNYHGAIQHHQVLSSLRGNHLFYFPTLGENFGHVTLEALVAGLPVLMSDQTPWRHLEAIGVGWDLPLDKPTLFQGVLQKCIDMGQAEYSILAKRAREYGIEKTNDSDAIEQNRDLFRLAVSRAAKPLRGGPLHKRVKGGE